MIGRVLTFLVLVLLGVTMAQAAPKRVAIASFGEHPALQEIVDGLKASLAERGFKDGQDVTYTFNHVNWERNLIPQMLTRISASKPDVLVLITTPVGQSAVRAVTDPTIPLVFVGIQDPVSAGLLPAWGKPTDRITGASNLTDMDGTLKFIRQMLPNLKRLGIPYNPGDDADNGLRERLVAAAPKYGIELIQIGIDNINDLPQRIGSFKGRAEAIFVLPSNLLQPANSQIAGMAQRMNIPAFNGTTAPIMKHEMLGAYTVDFYRVGVMGAGLVEQVLKGKKPADVTPTTPTAEDHKMVISGKELQRLKMTLPPELANCKCVVE